MIDVGEKGRPAETPGVVDVDATPHKEADRLTLDVVLAELRKQHFVVLSTADDEGMSHSAGVNYGVSETGGRIALYVMTRTHLRKTRNIARNPRVSLVVPVTRRLLWFLPPATIQLHGRAEILDSTDKVGMEVFSGFWIGRRILESYRESSRRGETRICFLKITPDPVITTYMLGTSVSELRSRMEKGVGRVTIPPDRL